MAKHFILIVLSLQLLCTLLEVPGQQSPCPEYFKYITDSATNETMGQIQILSPPKTYVLYLKVTLNVAIALPTNYVGKLELTQTKEETALMVFHGGSLLYYLRFLLSKPIPLLTGIWLNNKQYCSGPSALGEIVTSIMLKHTLFLPVKINIFTDLRPTFSIPSQWFAAESGFITSHFGDFAAGTHVNLQDITSTELISYQ